MKLYYMPGACSLASHIVLAWIGKPYETHKLAHGDLKKEPFIKVNPLGAVPTLEVDGHVITQNMAVLHYLADSSPETRLDGDGTAFGRAEVNYWLGFVNSDIHPAYKPLFGATAYLEDEAVIAKTKANAVLRLKLLFSVADVRLAGRNWAAGVRSIADAYLFAVLRWAPGQGIDLADYPNISKFMQHMNSDPSVQKVLKEEGLSE